ncbi:CBS domain-containing protein [Candidatus Saccharibacteria bacterium]|nr:CBS domain-containing protein [Candidatus Saccharibacteria bacterium]MBQ6605378.1 CBS domain-containing protein [Candidatus Saccharibacteria bacterium]
MNSDSFLERFLRKLTKFLDPRLEKYREKKPVEKKKLPAPKSKEELLDLLKRCPDSVLNSSERLKIASAMMFKTTKVSEIMLEKPAITFVRETDFMGPLTLDKLYRSGFKHFPVVDSKGDLVGILHTSSLNSLKIKETDRAFKYLDPNIFYVRADYSLEKAFAAFLRTNSYFFIVINKNNELVGLLTVEMLIGYLLGKAPTDKFEADSDRLSVAVR